MKQSDATERDEIFVIFDKDRKARGYVLPTARSTNRTAGGLSPGATALQAIGYKEFLDALEGRCTVQEAKEAVQKASRHYAKRQLTWFRRNKAIHWLLRQPGQDFPQLFEQAAAEIPFFDRPG